MTPTRAETYPVGAAVTVAGLDSDPHPIHHALRGSEPVSWLPALDGWLVTGHAAASEAMRDATTFTVDDPRFSTAQVVGPSMLSLDGPAHARHRAPFTGPFRAAAVRGRFAEAAAEEARTRLGALTDAGGGELRRGFAGPLAAAIVARALGLAASEVDAVLQWYDAIVASVTEISSGGPPTAAGADAFAQLRERLAPVIAGTGGDSLLAAAARGMASPGNHGAAPADPGGPGGSPADPTTPPGDPVLTVDEITANAAILLFGGIETTEGMIASAALELLTRPDELARVRADPDALDAVIDESLRLEPAAAVIDRYATRDAELGGAAIAAGELVRISITGAGRDPAVFPDPDAWDTGRPNLRRHLAFAQGPHVCVGVHLARLETRAALAELIALPGLRLDPDRPSPRVRGLVFRKPERLDAVWDPPGPAVR